MEKSQIMTHENWIQHATDSLSLRPLERREARSHARLLLDAVSGIRFAHLLRAEIELSDETREKLEKSLARLQKGEPLPYILGKAPFFGRDWRVGSGVLIPRPETELLIEAILARFDQNPRRVADLGTGSGIIAGTLAIERPQWKLWASEVSPTAREIARHNFQNYALERRIEWLEGQKDDWLAPLEPFPPLDLLVSNPPYIARAEIENLQIEVRDFEPRLALDGGEDGLHPYRQIAARGRQFLVPNGLCALEIGADQGQSVPALFEAAFWSVESVLKDGAGLDRVVLARNP